MHILKQGQNRLVSTEALWMLEADFWIVTVVIPKIVQHQISVDVNLAILIHS